eukprot:780542-Amphidinium_carterae.1
MRHLELPPMFREEEEVSILGNHSREEEILQRDYAERPPPLPPPFPEEPIPDPVVVDDGETVADEREESAPLEPLPEELVPEPPRPRQIQFAEDLVQYDDDPVDTGARGSGDYRTPSVPSQISQAPHRYRTRRNAPRLQLTSALLGRILNGETSEEEQPDGLTWSRIDKGVKKFVGSGVGGPVWDTVWKRST